MNNFLDKVKSFMQNEEGFLLFWSGQKDLQGNKVVVPFMSRWDSKDINSDFSGLEEKDYTEEELLQEVKSLCEKYGEDKFTFEFYEEEVL